MSASAYSSNRRDRGWKPMNRVAVVSPSDAHNRSSSGRKGPSPATVSLKSGYARRTKVSASSKHCTPFSGASRPTYSRSMRGRPEICCGGPMNNSPCGRLFGTITIWSAEKPDSLRLRATASLGAINRATRWRTRRRACHARGRTKLMSGIGKRTPIRCLSPRARQGAHTSRT